MMLRIGGWYLPTFRDNPSGPSSTVQLSIWKLLDSGRWDGSETSVTNYASTLHNIPEERTSRLHRGGGLKLQMIEW